MLNTAHELYDKLLNIYKLNMINFGKPHKRSRYALPKNLPSDSYLDEDEDDFPPMPALEGDEEVKLQPEKTIAERVKLNPQKKYLKEQD